ncbi:hypothetical protein ACIQZO_08905 [Streptomyces sp. NPDC097617]|uniref:hypothetical protein n=1 Tax=Streptomyces sp. NPDC097617 TaxID=3366091 RepID=UPI00381AB696
MRQLALRGIGACAAVLLAGPPLLALPARAHGHQQPAGSAVLRLTRAERQVEPFTQEYHDAAMQQHSEGKNTITVRGEYLTPELDAALATWTEQNQADPVFRAKDAPKSWSLASQSATETHEKVVVTETFEDGTAKDVWYRVRLDNFLIDGLQHPTV